MEWRQTIESEWNEDGRERVEWNGDKRWRVNGMRTVERGWNGMRRGDGSSSMYMYIHV